MTQDTLQKTTNNSQEIRTISIGEKPEIKFGNQPADINITGDHGRMHIHINGKYVGLFTVYDYSYDDGARVRFIASDSEREFEVKHADAYDCTE